MDACEEGTNGEDCAAAKATRHLVETVRLWDMATGREKHKFLGHTGPITTVAFTPDGRAVVSGSADATALVWDAATRMK